jgi:small-conductance mechanosensitive channel
MLNYTENHFYLLLASLAGLLIGFMLEVFLVKQIASHFKRKHYHTAYFIVSSLRGLLTIWFLTVSCFVTANILHVNASLNAWVNKLSLSVLVLTSAILSGRVLVKLIKIKTEHDGNAQQSTSIILNIVRVVIFVIGVMLVLQVFGISITPILTALGVGGLAVALALQDTLSNLFSGIQIVATKRIRNGDYILLDSGQEGYVEDITWRNTIIKNVQNNLVIVPNSKLSNSLITNYSFPEPELSVSLELSVSYSSDLHLVEKVVRETSLSVVMDHTYGVKSYEPLVRFHTFSESAISLRVTVRADHYDNSSLLKHELLKAIHLGFKKHGIEIPFPVRTVIMTSEKR